MGIFNFYANQTNLVDSPDCKSDFIKDLHQKMEKYSNECFALQTKTKKQTDVESKAWIVHSILFLVIFYFCCSFIINYLF